MSFSWISAENYDISRNLAENWNSWQNPANSNISRIFCSAGLIKKSARKSNYKTAIQIWVHSVTRTIFQVFAFKVTHRVILLTRFCKLLTRVATLSGGARDSSASMARRLWLVEFSCIFLSGSLRNCCCCSLLPGEGMVDILSHHKLRPLTGPVLITAWPSNGVCA